MCGPGRGPPVRSGAVPSDEPGEGVMDELLEPFAIVPAGAPSTYRLVGELDVMALPVVDKFVGELDALTDTVFDVADVAFVDSSGLHALLVVQRRLADAGRTLTLANPSPQLTRLLGIAGLAELFEVRPTAP
jgi:anti-sigma B factor antagonist